MPCSFSFVFNFHCFGECHLNLFPIKKKSSFFFAGRKTRKKFVIVISILFARYIPLSASNVELCTRRTPKQHLHFAITDHFQRVENKSRTKIVFHCCQFNSFRTVSCMNCVCVCVCLAWWVTAVLEFDLWWIFFLFNLNSWRRLWAEAKKKYSESTAIALYSQAKTLTQTH